MMHQMVWGEESNQEKLHPLYTVKLLYPVQKTAVVSHESPIKKSLPKKKKQHLNDIVRKEYFLHKEKRPYILQDTIK